MKYTKRILILILICFAQIFLLQSCKDDNVAISPEQNTSEMPFITGLSQVNLVSDVSTYNPVRIDPVLVNAWGIAVTPTGRLWISAAETGVSVIYDTAGNQVLAPVNIPGASGPGAPTGQVFNPTTSFKISGTPARFLFASEDGTISGWTSGATAVIVVNHSASNAVYKGLAIASANGQNYLFAADFHNAKIDVFDSSFTQVNSVQVPAMVPQHWAPFNIVNIGGNLFVTFAQQAPPDFIDDDPGPSRGIVLEFASDGSFIRPFAIRGTLNSPWGVVQTTPEFDGGNSILIGNFGDGKINIFSMDGHFKGQLRDTRNMAISIDGLWGLAFVSIVPGRLYFAAGPEDEEHGLFGYLKK
jgi:uncharacterized protein (TIGR03118 family)